MDGGQIQNLIREDEIRVVGILETIPVHFDEPLPVPEDRVVADGRPRFVDEVFSGDQPQIVDQGDIPAYRFGRVIRLKEDEVDAFIDNCRIEPGTLEHLYPEPIEQAK